jgi:hypothetical protein
MSGNILDPFETAVVKLLGAASLIESDDLDLDRVKKVGDGRVVESQMAVFADPRADDVGGLGQKQILVSQARQKRPIVPFSGDQAQAALIQPYQPEKMLLQIAAK